MWRRPATSEALQPGVPESLRVPDDSINCMAEAARCQLDQFERSKLRTVPRLANLVAMMFGQFVKRRVFFGLLIFLLHSRAGDQALSVIEVKLRGEFGIPKHLQNRKQKHNKATNTPNPKHNTTQKEHGKCLECETRGEKRVKRPKRPNALICRTPGGSIRYPLSCSLGMTLISHSSLHPSFAISVCHLSKRQLHCHPGEARLVHQAGLAS